ncbi:MAG: hypothetical protein ABI835_22240, partial [Chloroflexota bacterium]
MIKRLVLFALLSLAAAVPALAQDDVSPAPASIGADVPLTYFGPAPSNVQRELIGPYQLLKSGEVDTETGTITLPIYQGQLESGETVWYILTDTNDAGNAAALGLNFSGKLTYADVENGVRSGQLQADGTVIFDGGAVDFSPEHSITPGDAPNAFPPSAFQPGSVGDADYTPLVKIGNYIYNAPIVAFDVDAATLDAFCVGSADHSIVHDKVVAICPSESTVTIGLTPGFSFGRPVLYLST